MRTLLFYVTKWKAALSKLKNFVQEFRVASDAAEALFFWASSLLATLSARLNSSFLCACPPVNIIEGLELFLMSPVCAFWVNLHQPGSSSCLLRLSHHFVSSPSPTSLLVSPSIPALPPSLLIPLHSASFEEVRLLSAWRNKSDLWMGQPTWVLEGEASGSQALWSSSPLFPPASLQGKLLCLSRLWSFTVLYRRHMLPLSDSQTAWIPTHCRGVCVCKTIFSRGSHKHCHSELLSV